MRRLADLQERSRDRKEPRERRSSEPEHAVEPEHDVERRLGALHKRLSKTSPALARELEFPVDERAAAGGLPAGMGAVRNGFEQFSTALMNLENAIGQAWKGIDRTPASRVMMDFAAPLDNISTNIEPEMRDNLVKLELAVRQLGRP